MAYDGVSKRGQVANFAFALLAIIVISRSGAAQEAAAVVPGAGGRLVYERDELGNRVPDFSHCGYAGAERGIPTLPVRVKVPPANGDNTARIRAAIDEVARLPIDERGFRGAVLLEPGRFEIAGQIRISASGVVLRGSGAGEEGTVLVAMGLDRRPLVRIVGKSDLRELERYRVADEYVPVGATSLRLDATPDLKVGDPVIVTRPSTIEWIKAIGMDDFGIEWKPGTRDIRWDRTITGIDGDIIELDAPITTAIAQRFGGAVIRRYDWPGRINNVGIEDLRMESQHDAASPHDEDHSWFGVTMENVRDAWVRRVEFLHFPGGAVALWDSATRVTVEDCIAREPVSELGGYRRHTFSTQGQSTLFLRCWSQQGRHDFAIGHCAAGPNAFVNCYADEALGDSGPIESWASGVLYDNVRIDGAGLALDNRWATPPGTGWSAANSVLWQCQAAMLRVFRPPTANNWAIGAWGSFAGDGTIAGRSDFVKPISLYQAQLRERKGASHAAHVAPGLIDPVGSTNPTIAEAAKFTEDSRKPARQLIDVIRERMATSSAPRGGNESNVIEKDNHTAGTAGRTRKLAVENGWLVLDGELLAGGRIQQGFWRGTIRPVEAAEYGPAITRFVPGRVGRGFTDNLTEVAGAMRANDVAVFDHHYGLWYDRRRDDHTMVRRQNGDVAPPFYEQPFARTGRGRAWDGLSKYDLSQFNPWYWGRLREFARLCDERGLVLFHQNYFQHNILEAGAHWADCPWRPANNVNETGLPEPPNYIGDKRIFLAAEFYDVSHPQRRELHRGYIRHGLDNFAATTNVIQMTGAEYSGPLEFIRFWLDTIIEWRHERRAAGKPAHVLVGLSAPKDVQDAILADATRGPHVDVIDIRYWAYTANGELYAPKGGQNFAPRQHLRQTKLKPGDFAAIVKAVREYRSRYSDKAVTYYADQYCPSTRDGWAVLMGGGSLPNVKLPAALARILPTLAPADDFVEGDRAWCLANKQGHCVVYTDNVGGMMTLRLPRGSASFHVHWLDVKTNELTSETIASAEWPLRLRAKSNVVWLEPSAID